MYHTYFEQLFMCTWNQMWGKGHRRSKLGSLFWEDKNSVPSHTHSGSLIKKQKNVRIKLLLPFYAGLQGPSTCAERQLARQLCRWFPRLPITLTETIKRINLGSSFAAFSRVIYYTDHPPHTFTETTQTVFFSGWLRTFPPLISA